MSDLPKKIGKYEIKALAGKGGMGTVYLGYDPFEDRDVAVKVCRLRGESDRRFRKLARKAFFNEAHCAKVLKHPNILQIFDAGLEDDDPYIVMEYVEGGGTLKPHTSRRNLLPPKSVVRLLYKCANALDYAHRKGVVHRDIKPANLMLTRSGEVKIADFGVAFNAASNDTQLTRMVGTLLYMSPEQVQEAEVTSQTDLYSLGVVGFELLAGQTPFDGKRAPRLARKIVEAPAPSLREVRPGLPARLEEVLGHLLQKEPDRRHKNARELAADLASVYGELEEAGKIGDTVRDLSYSRKFEMARELEFFNDFSDEELSDAVRTCHWQFYEAGEVIVREGAEDYAFYVLAEGEVEVTVTGKSIGTLSKGTCFGEMNFLSKTRRTATVTAIEDVHVLRTDTPLLEQTSVHCQLRFNQVLTKVLLERLTRTTGRLAKLAP